MTEEKKDRILLGFYGDDFTGSTDVLLALSVLGLRVVLFTSLPSREQIEAYQSADVIGIAGATRSMDTNDIPATLIPCFNFFKELNPLFVHYKVCSTFDSSPSVGSIGKAIDVGQSIFKTEYTPLLVGSPELGRYCAFGNLFARMGIGVEEEIYRLDRHPSMKNHPITPADESDLTLHLAKQTTKKIGLFDILELEKSEADRLEKIEKLREDYDVVLFDVLFPEHLKRIGQIIDKSRKDSSPLFMAGSSGIESALGAWWKGQGVVEERSEWPELKEKSQILIVSGSCSPITGNQIEQAIADGFKEVSVSPEILSEEAGNEKLTKFYSDKVTSLLQNGESVIIHTCLGPKDDRLLKANDLLGHMKSKDSGVSVSTAYGSRLVQLCDAILKRNKVERLGIAGGDTSSYIMQNLGIESIEIKSPFIAGAPICTINSSKSHLNGIELNLKGGQVGDSHYFRRLREGKIYHK